MGVPYHTSRDIPGRCLYLIDRLHDQVKEVEAPHGHGEGPLDTTFLFAMSVLILTLPIERLEKHRMKEKAGAQGYLDDRPLDKDAARDVDAVLGDASIAFSSSPFFVPRAWRFASIEFTPGMNLAVSFPDELGERLRADSAMTDANTLSARDWARVVRNALAHGGIVYLDGEGNQAVGARTELMGFVSAQYPGGNMNKPPEHLVALRVSPDGFRTTLRRWVQWVQNVGLTDEIAA